MATTITPTIVTINTVVTEAPLPSQLQQSAIIVSCGGTTLSHRHLSILQPAFGCGEYRCCAACDYRAGVVRRDRHRHGGNDGVVRRADLLNYNRGCLAGWL